MAVWEIPQDKIISYAPNGDLTKDFAQKVKWCLEAAFDSIKELHDTSGIGGIPIELNDVVDGQALVYRESVGKFINENKNILGGDKSLIVTYGDTPLVDFNGSNTTRLDLQQALGGTSSAATTADIAHALRLVENLYLTLEIAQLDPGGYDGLSGNTFFGGINDIDLDRSVGTITDGKVYGNGATLITKPISFVNKVTGDVNSVSRAHLTVKHRNVADASISAEIAIRNAAFVKGELLAIGDGAQHTAILANTTNLDEYGFVLYFDGVAQSNYTFTPANGQVTFTAPVDVIVTADYFYNWGTETFAPMTKTGTYPDYRNPARASTQFVYSGSAGSVAVLKLTLNQGSGTATNEINTISTGQPQGFKLQHQPIINSIQVTPSTVPWQYNESQNVIVINTAAGTAIQVSYQWEGKSLGVDSFACTFNG